MTEVLRWNSDKPHRCPACHASTIDDFPYGPSLSVYTCCTCGARFTRWPRLAWLMSDAGIRCAVHRSRVRR